jgi:cytochrome c oxidase subunit 4
LILTVTFYAVRAGQDRALEHYLATHPVGHTLAETVEQVETSEPTHTHDHHSSVKVYIQVALILALMTAVEVALLYLPEGMRPPRWSLLIVLLLMSVLKFGIVASFFMHLRYDSRLYTSFFVAGLVVAAGTMLVLLVLFYDPAPLRSATHTPSRAPHALGVQPAGRMAGNRALMPSL